MARQPNYVRIEIADFKRRMAPIVGGEVFEVDAQYIDGEVYPLLLIRAGGREYVLQVLRDAGHNGPGHANLMPL